MRIIPALKIFILLALGLTGGVYGNTRECYGLGGLGATLNVDETGVPQSVEMFGQNAGVNQVFAGNEYARYIGRSGNFDFDIFRYFSARRIKIEVSEAVKPQPCDRPPMCDTDNTNYYSLTCE